MVRCLARRVATASFVIGKIGLWCFDSSSKNQEGRPSFEFSEYRLKPSLISCVVVFLRFVNSCASVTPSRVTNSKTRGQGQENGQCQPPTFHPSLLDVVRVLFFNIFIGRFCIVIA